MWSVVITALNLPHFCSGTALAFSLHNGPGFHEYCASSLDQTKTSLDHNLTNPLQTTISNPSISSTHERLTLDIAKSESAPARIAASIDAAASLLIVIGVPPTK